jgi:hypothetical protein
MARSAVVPSSLSYAPFRGSVAVADGLLTHRQLGGATWRRLFRDVYICAEAPLDHLTWCQAAALLLPAGAALSHASAALLYGADVLSPGHPVEATAPASLGVRSQTGLRIVRSPLPVADTWRVAGDLPVRTAFDLARRPDLVSAVVGVDALLYRRAVKPAELAQYVAAHAGWNGIRGARRAVELARADVESPMESRVRLRIVLSGLPEPVVQYDVRDRSGRFVARLDLAYPLSRVGIEYDGDHHRERATFRFDAVRANRLRLLGWTVLHFNADEIRRKPDRMLAQIRAALNDDALSTLFEPVDVDRASSFHDQICCGVARRSASGSGGSYSRTILYRVFRSTGVNPASRINCSRSSRCMVFGVP